MRTSKRLVSPTSWICNEFGVYEPNAHESERSTLCIARQIQEVEKARRVAYRRFARTVGISWLECRRAAKGEK